MAAEILFFAGDDIPIHNIAESGLGFYGVGGFNRPVPVGQYQSTTYITDSTGTLQGPICNNVKWAHPNSGTIEGSVILNLLNIPFNHCPLNIRFVNDTEVITENIEVRIYDRSDINASAIGVTTKVAELIHPSTDQGVTGSGDTSWITPGGYGPVVRLCESPGPTGYYAGSGAGSTYYSTQHDWYLAISASPNSIGSKTEYGLYVSLDYL